MVHPVYIYNTHKEASKKGELLLRALASWAGSIASRDIGRKKRRRKNIGVGRWKRERDKSGLFLKLIEFVTFLAENWYPEGKQNILAGAMAETVVSGLRPWSVYHLRIFAENQLGKSKEGKVLQVRRYLD